MKLKELRLNKTSANKFCQFPETSGYIEVHFNQYPNQISTYGDVFLSLLSMS